MAGIGFDPGVTDAVKSARSASTSVGGTASADITTTWDDAFPDTNYTVTIAVQGPNSNISEPSWYVKAKTVSAVTVRVANAALTAQNFTVHAMGIAD